MCMSPVVHHRRANYITSTATEPVSKPSALCHDSPSAPDQLLPMACSIQSSNCILRPRISGYMTNLTSMRLLVIVGIWLTKRPLILVKGPFIMRLTGMRWAEVSTTVCAITCNSWLIKMILLVWYPRFLDSRLPIHYTRTTFDTIILTVYLVKQDGWTKISSIDVLELHEIYGQQS